MYVFYLRHSPMQTHPLRASGRACPFSAASGFATSGISSNTERKRKTTFIQARVFVKIYPLEGEISIYERELVYKRKRIIAQEIAHKI